ncbi:MAG: DUF58 domain-containing protein [Halobacteriaceae archaeon]
MSAPTTDAVVAAPASVLGTARDALGAVSDAVGHLPRPTRRGVAVLVVVLAATGMALTAGRRSLDVVVVAGLALLLAGLAGVLRVEAPTVTRTAVEFGTVGESVPVELGVRAPNDPVVTVRDALPAGVTGAAAFEAVADGRPLTYDAHLRTRGRHELGPAVVTVHDAFGCWARRFPAGPTATVLAVPRTRALHGRSGLLSGYTSVAEERSEFERLREYRRGDALRDVNWKASAKHPSDLVVTEYGSAASGAAVLVGVDAPDADHADAAAEAAASVAVHLFEAGLAVGVVTPDGRVVPARGEGHRRELLAALARFEAAPLPAPETEDADVVVRATGDAVEVLADGSAVRFEALLATDGADSPDDAGGPTRGVSA